MTEAAASSPLLLDLHEGVQTITLNRPNQLNAITGTTWQTLADVVRAAERDQAVKVLVLTGAGRAFSSGADVGEFKAAFQSGERPEVGGLLRTVINPLIQRLHSMEKPVLAAVNGVAAGAGMGLALACDIRYAAESARFVLAFVNIGLVPDAGCTYFLPRLVGASKALELAWTGAPIGAAEALDLGLVNRVLPDAEVLSAAQSLGARLAQGPSTALALMKRGFSQAHELPLGRVLEAEAGYQAIAGRTRDFMEGVGAFLEKRTPTFSGR